MNFATSATAFFLALVFSITAHSSSVEKFVKAAAIENGLKKASDVNQEFDPALAKLGASFFESKAMSLNGDISCQTCHLDKFGSADGIPNGIGVGGKGEGEARVLHGGAVLPRNTLALWGRAVLDFKTFFWDGKVDFSDTAKMSQFGSEAPSKDPLEVAIHLPVVEIREMLAEDNFIASAKREEVTAANEVYSAIMERLITKHESELAALADTLDKNLKELSFHDIAVTIKHFFRQKFALQRHKFEKFVFEDASLSEAELDGALLFYGKGKCAVCHSGTLFSDLSFHSVPLGQLGSGRNGFGVDYGRFNVTHDPKDLYKFRTPPLLDVNNTAPYGHSGSAFTLREAITRHFDPLRDVNFDKISQHQRVELYKQIAASSSSSEFIPYLNDAEVADILSFLNTLSFSPIEVQ